MAVVDHEKNTHQASQSTPEIKLKNQSEKENVASDFDFLSLLDSELETIRGTNKKFSLIKNSKQNFFLPSLNECSKSIFGMSLRKLMELVEIHRDKRMPISRNSRSSLFNNGAGFPTVKKFFGWLKILMHNFSSKMDRKSASLMQKGALEPSTSGEWLGLVAGVRSSDAFQDPMFASEYIPLLDYIEQRCDSNIEMNNNIHGCIQAGTINPDSPMAIMRLIRPHLALESLIPDEELNAYEKSLKEFEFGNVDSQSVVLLLRSYHHIYFDFFLNLFSSYEVGCVITYHEDVEEIMAKRGLLSRTIMRYIENCQSENFRLTFFGEFLEEIRKLIPNNGVLMSKREMSMSLPMVTDPNNPSLDSESDRHYKKFKSWQTGKEIPSMQSIEKFFDNLTKDLGRGTNHQITLLSQMALWLDKEVAKWRELLDNSKELDAVGPVMDGLYAAIGRYETYYQHHLKKHIGRKAGV